MGAETTTGWIGGLLPLTLWIAAVAGLAWLALSWWDARTRRAHNLTRADQDGAGADPGFLSVDHEKRAAAIEAGKVFDEKIKARDAAPEPAIAATARQAMPWMQRLTLGFGVVSIALAALNAFARVERIDAAVRDLTSLEAFTQIVQQYWIGFVIVLATIVVQIFKTYQSYKSS